MLRLAGERDKLNVVFDQVGTPTNAADLAVAILSVIQISAKDKGKFVPGIYHYSNEGVASWYDFAKAIFEIADIKCEVSPVLSDQFPTPAKRRAEPCGMGFANGVQSLREVHAKYLQGDVKACPRRLQWPRCRPHRATMGARRHPRSMDCANEFQ